MVASILKEKIKQRLNEEVPTKYDNDNDETCNWAWREMDSDYEATRRKLNNWIFESFNSISKEFLKIWVGGVVYLCNMNAADWKDVVNESDNQIKKLQEIGKIIHEYRDIAVKRIANKQPDDYIGKIRQSMKQIENLQAKAKNRIK